METNAQSLNNLVKKYNISNDDLVKFSSLCHEYKKLGVFDFLKTKNLQKERQKIIKKYKVGFMDGGGLIISCERVPLITTENVETYYLIKQEKSDEEIKEEKEREQKEKIKEEEGIKHEKEQKGILSKVKKLRKEILDEYDKDRNGEVDITECDDLSKILKKNQSKIIEIDRNNIQKFVQISNYLKIQRDNIKVFFNRVMLQEQRELEIMKLDEEKEEINIIIRKEFDLDEFTSNVEVFKDYVHSYNLLLSCSLNMIVSLTNDDMITFFEIYESLDKLNIFDSTHEKEVKEKLTNIEYGLVKMRNEINIMNNQICNSLEQLSEITLESSNMITKELSSVNSSLKMNNLLQGIQVYQNYKTNKRLK
jgi:hypothetical protein